MKRTHKHPMWRIATRSPKHAYSLISPDPTAIQPQLEVEGKTASPFTAPESTVLYLALRALTGAGQMHANLSRSHDPGLRPGRSFLRQGYLRTGGARRRMH